MKMTKINIWDEWAKNFENAKAFFTSKGNIKTKAKLKKKWHDDYFKTFEKIEDIINKRNFPKIPSVGGLNEITNKEKVF